MIWFIVVIGVVVVLALVVRMLRPSPDPVDSFRRQIDALSPEARRPTVDKVRDAAEETDETDVDET
jgi:hypothetical protein